MAALLDDTFVAIDDVFVVMDCRTAAELTATDAPDTTLEINNNQQNYIIADNFFNCFILFLI